MAEIVHPDMKALLAGKDSFHILDAEHRNEDEKLAEWKNVFFPEAQGDVPNSSIFHTCLLYTSRCV